MTEANERERSESPQSFRVDLDTLVRDLGVDRYVDESRQATIARSIAKSVEPWLEPQSAEKLPRYGFLFETQGLRSYSQLTSTREPEILARVQTSFGAAFQCWRALASLPNGHELVSRELTSAFGLRVVAHELHDELLSPSVNLGVRVAAAGLIAGRSAETRLELERFDLAEDPQSNTWRDQVAHHVATAFIRLARKGNGWADVSAALQSISMLRELQHEAEGQYINASEDAAEQTIAAVELVGHYHLAQLVSLTGEYLRDGVESSTLVNGRIDRHHDRAKTAFESARQGVLMHVADLYWAGCRELVQNAIWTHIGVSERAREFGRLLAGLGRPSPVIELWPSQQRALRQNLLDPYKRAILVEMPTSAGKTLLAKFAIVQSRVLNPSGTVAYIVPTRALVNQITLDLREDLGLVKLRVEQAVPATELDPLEAKLLSGLPDVLVTTPEKLDLLLKRDHAATKNLALVIADEAHNLRDSARGARLELLLGMIKRDRADARFLLLSPFLPNDKELVDWLGDDRALDPIKVDWKPSSRVVGAVTYSGRGKARRVVLESLPAGLQSEVAPGRIIPLSNTVPEGSATLKRLSQAAVRSFSSRGAVLVLCAGKGTAATRAAQLSSDLPIQPADEFRDAVCHYLEAEMGLGIPIVDHIRRGVAYHHAGLSHEARWLIEGLIRRNKVNIVCGTTTLAQGVNFPISSVVIETLEKGTHGQLGYEDFWNIAGRAGRALVDPVGVVAFPVWNSSKRDEYVHFLEGEAKAIASQLATLVARADEIVASNFNINAVFKWPELASFMQFLSHAMRVAGKRDLADEAEDLLRASLVYRQAQKAGNASAQKLVNICKAYLAHAKSRPDIIALADQTGFATPSVLHLRTRTQDIAEFNDASRWSPTRLFGRDIAGLKERVQAIADLPEMQLGPGKGQPFSPERVAQILRDWVNGKTLNTLAKDYPISATASRDQQISEFSKYLFGQLLGRASWGMGAMENVCLFGDDSPARQEAGYVPSMIFFGVNQKEAVWLRMVGVPRVAADGLGKLWKSEQKKEPESYDELRQWISGLSENEWRSALGNATAVNGGDMRLLWSELSGTPGVLHA